MGMTPVARSTMMRTRMKTITQMIMIIFMFFHQNLRATFCDVVLKCSDCWGWVRKGGVSEIRGVPEEGPPAIQQKYLRANKLLNTEIIYPCSPSPTHLYL